ncbi:dihydroneopterin aldolase [Parabacteroides sp. AF48-14]|uniref:dihydroneopterin aldolase n=1 Tax=Parabacteroides sp. AF48-14 TaxID=2292052 RepID=UPI000F001752|nr:dihydroneopterin aldolase [Parabacteroides sp. AF48-14]RHO75270.1 dihydroneopterin aldolase [Parabacteroides sp. AF48-14]
MTTRIELEAMKFYAYHGVMPQERKVGNNFVVNLILTAPLDKAVTSDELEDTINYAAVYAVVKEQMEKPSKLIEHAAGRILQALKGHFPQLTAIELKLAKLNPPFGGDVYSASIILSETYC